MEALRREILCLQGLSAPLPCGQPVVPLGPVLENMPGGIFPTGAIHELLSHTTPAYAATSGFMAAILNSLLQDGKCGLWVSAQRTLFPPALKAFGLDPERMIFIDTVKEKEVIWTMEEALKCDTLGAVVGEIKELDFTASRRLQLAVERSKVTGFIHRTYPRNIKPTACVARWQVRSLNSGTFETLPGIGLPRWQVELLKIRSGQPGAWQLEWTGNAFHAVEQQAQQSHRVVLPGKTVVA